MCPFRETPDYIKVAEMFEGSKKITVAEVDCDAESNKALCSKHGVSGYPTLKYFPQGQPTADVKYEGARSVDDIAKFISEKAGERARIAPKHYVDLTPEEFDKVVMDPTQNVIVAFTAPWCGHCQHLAPEYEKAAASFLPSDKVIFGKVDADKYKELGAKYDVQGFPTIKFFAAGDKTPKAYEGGREAKDLVEYMNAHSGAERVVGGGLLPTAGRVALLDAIAAKFKDASAEEQKKLHVEAKEAVAALSSHSQWSAGMYLKAMEAVLAKGPAYIQTETARLEKIIASKAAAASKLDEFTKRLHILQAF